MSTLENAIALAAMVHEGIKDKAGAPYLLHPLRIMFKMSSNEERIVAVLHDVVEDCGITLDQLRAKGFTEEVVNAVESVTITEDEKKAGDEGYKAFVLRAAANKIGRKVKLADLEDNMDLTRITNPTQKDHDRITKRYRPAVETIRSIPD